MIAIRDLLVRPDLDAPVPTNRPNPLLSPGELQESMVLDVSLDVVTSTGGVLLDLRVSLDEGASGAFGLLVVRGLEATMWQNQAGRRGLTAWNVLDFAPLAIDGAWEAWMGLYPDGELTIRGASAEYYELDVVGQVDYIVDYTENNPREVAGVLPDWASQCFVRARWTSSLPNEEPDFD
jgi:hypothetical protein